jgi:hypothetical protein
MMRQRCGVVETRMVLSIFHLNVYRNGSSALLLVNANR